MNPVLYVLQNLFVGAVLILAVLALVGVAVDVFTTEGEK